MLGIIHWAVVSKSFQKKFTIEQCTKHNSGGHVDYAANDSRSKVSTRVTAR